MARTGSHEVRDTAYGMNATLGVGFIPMAKGPRNLGIDFGSATLTHYGGAYLMHRFLTRLGVKAAFAHDIRVVQRNHRFSVGEMLLAWLYPMVLGLERIETTQLLQQDGSPTPAGALALRSGLDGFGALRQTRRGAHRRQPQQAGAPFLLPAAVFRSPDPGLLAWRVATRGCGHAARRAGVRPSLLCQSPAQCPARDFARRQRVFRSQADRLGGAARRKLRHRGTAYSADPTATERSALPPLRLGRRDRWVSLPASRLDTSGAFRSDPTAAAGGSQRTTATVSTRALSLPSSRHQSAPAATQPLALLQPSRCRRADHQAAQRRLRPGPHPHAPLLGQRNLLPFALAGLQPDELVQAALPAARFPDRHTANIAPESLVDARTVAAHSQPTEPRPARERAARNRVATCTRKNRTTQTLRT